MDKGEGRREATQTTLSLDRLKVVVAAAVTAAVIVFAFSLLFDMQ